MKKFLSVLTLVLALCLACGSAFAATTFDYANPILVTNPGTGEVIVKFPEEGKALDDENIEFQEWKVYVDAPEYAALKDLTNADVDVKFVVVKKATCVADAVLELIPQNVSAKLRTSNPDDAVQDAATADDLKKVGYSYYGLLKEFPQNVNKVVDMAELKKANAALYELYKAGGHDYSTGKVRVEKAATCEENGVVYPVCDVCKAEGEAVVTEPLGHVEILTASLRNKMIKEGSVKVGEHTFTLLIAPNCCETGLYEGYCPQCKAEDVIFEIAKNKNAHVYGAWQTEKAPTCTEMGLEYRLCTICLEAKEERFAEALGHDLIVNHTKEATCGVEGEADKITCSRCDIVATVKDSALVITNAVAGDEANIALLITGTDAELGQLSYTLGTKVFLTPLNPENHPFKYWVLDTAETVKPTCEEDGANVYKCELCGNIANTAIVPALGHDLKTVIEVKDGSTWTVVAKMTCAETNGKQNTYRSNTTCARGCGMKAIIEALEAPAHDYDKWVMRNDVSEDTPGYWIRECKVCHIHDEYIGYEAPAEEEEPVVAELKLEDGKFVYYENGKKVPEFVGLVEYDGALFFVEDGVVASATSGLTIIDSEFYFLANGMVQTAAEFAMYDGYTFALADGKLNIEFNGLQEYDGALFLFAAGQLKKDVNGLWLNPVDDVWYFLANGLVQTQYSGIAEYDGALFLLKDGTLAKDAAGIVEQNGVKYIVDAAGNAAIYVEEAPAA